MRGSLILTILTFPHPVCRKSGPDQNLPRYRQALQSQGFFLYHLNGSAAASPGPQSFRHALRASTTRLEDYPRGEIPLCQVLLYSARSRRLAYESNHRGLNPPHSNYVESLLVKSESSFPGSQSKEKKSPRDEISGRFFSLPPGGPPRLC